MTVLVIVLAILCLVSFCVISFLAGLFVNAATICRALMDNGWEIKPPEVKL